MPSSTSVSFRCRNGPPLLHTPRALPAAAACTPACIASQFLRCLSRSCIALPAEPPPPFPSDSPVACLVTQPAASRAPDPPPPAPVSTSTQQSQLPRRC